MSGGPTLGQVPREAIKSEALDELRLSPQQWKTVRALALCRTSALGGQFFACRECGKEHFVAHSCRNRHCPQCQGGVAVDWLAQQEATLLPVPYFHLVFTMPHALNGVIRQNRRALLNLLFSSANATLLEFGEGKLKARIGITAVLHTWSQTLMEHYHLHCIVTGGGVALDGTRWIHSPAHYLFPVPALSVMFRGKFLSGLQELFESDKLEFHAQMEALAQAPRFKVFLQELARPNWGVYSKRPFAGPQQVLAYLSRYTHRVAITNGRLLQADGSGVTFVYKDYADGAKRKTMTLSTQEFIRRFCLHVLPERFVKIRHYGLLGNRQKHERLAGARQLLGVTSQAESPGVPEGKADHRQSKEAPCPFCGRPGLIRLCEIPPTRNRVPRIRSDSS